MCSRARTSPSAIQPRQTTAAGMAIATNITAITISTRRFMALLYAHKSVPGSGIG